MYVIGVSRVVTIINDFLEKGMHIIGVGIDFGI